MEPADILQRNHVVLKEKLDVDSCLDNLFQERVITEQELDICHSKQSRPEKCEYLLTLLRRKEVGDYKIFCAVLERIGQKSLKEQLDATSTESGSLSLVYVNKQDIERRDRTTITALEQRIASLTHELEQKNKDITDVICERDKAIQELKTDHEAQMLSKREEMQIQISKLKEDLRQESESKYQAERTLSETRMQLQNVENDNATLQEKVKEVQQKYTSITSSDLQDLQRARDQRADVPLQLGKETEESCGVCHVILNPDAKVFILSCLHNLCHSCLDNDQGSTELECSKCHNRTSREDVKMDAARRNKVSLESVKTTMTCTFNISHEGEMAVCYCQDCERTLCSSCQSAHEQTTTCTSHKTYRVEEMESIHVQKLLKATACPRHPSKVVELYDTDCQMSICHICTLEDHKGHSMTCIDRAYEQARSKLDEIAADLEIRTGETEKRIQELIDHEKALGDREEVLVKQLAETREKLNLLMFHREQDVRGEIKKTFEELRRTLSEKMNRLKNVNESLHTTTGFIRRISEFCTRSEFFDFEGMVKAKAKLDLNLDLTEDEERNTKIQISFQGLRALESQIRSFFFICSLDNDQGEVSDDVPTNEEFQQRLIQSEKELADRTDKLTECERDLQEMEKAKMLETSLLKMRVEENKRLREEEKMQFRREKHLLMSEVKRSEEQIQREKEKYDHLSIRCTEKEEKLQKQRENEKGQQQQYKKKLQSIQAEINRLKKSYGQLEQTLDQTVICVGRHKSDCENSCLVVCPRLAFSPDRLNCIVGSIVQNVFTNSPSDKQVHYARCSPQPFRNYNGTTSTMPIFPAPNRLHEHPIFWEVAAETDLNRELLSSNIVFETGVIGESSLSLDRNPLAYRDSLAWCIIVKFCTKHRSICTQVWQKGIHVICFSDSMPNRRGASVTLRFGGILDATKGKLKIAFLDLTKEILLGIFDLRDTEPHMLVFGFPPKADNCSVKLKLTPPREVDMTSEKKSLILRALSQM